MSHEDGASAAPVKVVSMLPILGHPRDSKRITMLQEAGCAVEAVAFERDYHTGRLPDCRIERLGRIAHGRYLRRMARILAALPAIRRAMRRNDVAYASGPDMAFMALIAGIGLGRPVVLEVGDVREVQVARGLKGWLVRAVDKRFTDACALLVATAPGFVDVYYRQWLKASIRAMVIENKLESSYADTGESSVGAATLEGRPLVDRPLRIGYFGGLRCEWSWQVLRGLAQARPDEVEILLAGYPMNPPDLVRQVEGYANIKYLGQYRSPQDLPSLYGSVDLAWACYQHIGPDDWNLRWARTNRFYEGCFFKTPLVSRSGCCDAVEVDRYNLGITIKDHEVDKVVDVLSGIRSDDLATWKSNMAKLPREFCVYTTETSALGEALRELVKAKRGCKDHGHGC